MRPFDSLSTKDQKQDDSEARALTPPLRKDQQPAAAGDATDPVTRRWPRWIRHPVAIHLAVLIGYIAVGIAVTWPHATYLAGRLPDNRDAACYVWDFWWMAHSVEHFSNPWSTTYLAAPVGTQLGLHALMPLVGVVMMPITVLFGPSASYTLLSIMLPGLLSYAMYRVARLWLRSQIAAIAAGGFFGYSVIVEFWTWNHINLAAGALFLPMTLEAAVRMRRKPGPLQAVILGLVIGASVLVDQDSALMAAMVAIAAVLPWLVGRPRPADPADRSLGARVLGAPRVTRLAPVALAAIVTAVVASPQLFAIANEAAVGGPPTPPDAVSYTAGVHLPNIVEPSARTGNFGLPAPHPHDFRVYGAVLTILALAGLALAWRRRTAWALALAWLGATVLAMGSTVHIGSAEYVPVAQVWRGVQLSSIMPYTWLVHLPGLASFRVPGRVAALGLVPAALLAGFTINYLRDHAKPAMIAVLAVAFLEAGLATPPSAGTMPTALPALDRPIAADHTASIVVDVPFGLRGGVGLRGDPFNPESQVLATADGHPLAVANLSRIPPSTDIGMHDQPFFNDLMAVQNGHYYFTPEHLQDAAKNARSINIGWVLLWNNDRHVVHFLRTIGFRFAYRANGVSVYRPAPASR
ncbi:MAG TPA: hypothetical protein VF162_06735 [Streptosporangiaceae bacterium]